MYQDMYGYNVKTRHTQADSSKSDAKILMKPESYLHSASSTLIETVLCKLVVLLPVFTLSLEITNDSVMLL